MKVVQDSEDQTSKYIVNEPVLVSLPRYQAPIARQEAVHEKLETAISIGGIQCELTVTEAVADPLIALLNEADCICNHSFAQLMQSAARVLNGKFTKAQS